MAAVDILMWFYRAPAGFFVGWRPSSRPSNRCLPAFFFMSALKALSATTSLSSFFEDFFDDFKSSVIRSSRASLLPYPRVQHRVHQVSQKIHSNVGQSNCQNAALDNEIIAIGNCVDGEPPHARPGKNLLGHDRTCQERSELQSQHGYDWNHGIAQGMVVDDPCFRNTLGAGGADIVVAEVFEHGG